MATAITTPVARTLPRFWRITHWRLRQKLLAAFLTVTVVPLVIAGIISVNVSRSALLNLAQVNLAYFDDTTATRIDQYLATQRETIVAASALPQIVAFAATPSDQTAKADALKQLKNVNDQNAYESVAIVDKQGTIILSSADADVSTSVKDIPYFTEALDGKVYISDPSVSTITNKPAIFFSAPILSANREILGVLLSRLSLDGIWALVESDKDKAGIGTFGMLLDDNGLRLAHSQSLENRDAVMNNLLFRAVSPIPAEKEKQLIEQKRFGNASGEGVAVLPLPEVARAIANPAVKTFESSADNSPVRHYAVIASLNTMPWHYIIMTPLPTLTSAADSLGYVFITIAVLVAALASIAAIFMARAVTRPIVQLTQVAERISLGELDAKIEVTSQDEIGEFADAFSRMQASLQVAMERLRARRMGG